MSYYKKFIYSIILFLVATSSIFSADYKVIGYYPNWAIYRSSPFKPKDINPELLTHICYAFINYDTAGNLVLFDPWADVQYREEWNSPDRPFWGNFYHLVQLKKKHPHLKTMASIGGWTLSDNFSVMAANPQARKNFVKNCIQFCDQYQFDGIDLDWEYPGFEPHRGRPEDKINFTLLLKELHAAAKAHQPALLVSIAAPAGPWNCENIELEKIHSYLDHINLMCYDMHGPWGGSGDPVTNHHAPLYPTKEGHSGLNIDSVIKYYLAKGVPPEKIILGMPLYGRTFAQANSTSTGLFSSYSGPGTSTTAEAGLRFFSDIKKNLIKTYVLHWDAQSQVPYLHNPKTHDFITFDNETSFRIKCEYIKEMNLGGAMVWDLSMDVIPTWDAMSTISDELNK